MSDAEVPFYLDESKVEAYLTMHKGLEGKNLVRLLLAMLEPSETVLELGMGPGADLILLSRYFNAVGSDYSAPFLKRFSKIHPDIEVICLNAVSIKTTRKFDCIYSNKVLHHLNPDQLQKSFERQAQVVRPGGLLFHSFWPGEETRHAEGLLFRKIPMQSMVELAENYGEVISTGYYEELIQNDSYFLAVRTPEF